MKLAYRYDPTTHEYVGEDYLQIDRVATEKLHGHIIYAKKANVTDVVPPSPRNGCARVFNETESYWMYYEDHRNERVINVSTKEIGKYPKLGPIEFPYVTDIPDERFLPYVSYTDSSWVLTDRERLLNDLWGIRKSRRDAECESNLEYNGHVFRVDPRSLNDIMMAAQEYLLSNDPLFTKRWVSADTSNVTLTGDDIIAILREYGARRQRLVYESNAAWQEDCARDDENLLSTYLHYSQL